MTSENIQSLGNLLATYYSDLVYIRNFHRFKNGKINFEDYIQNSPGKFKSFINNYRVARNVQKGFTNILLKSTSEWISTSTENDVDKFANRLLSRDITHGKIMTSLASKILFLNNPWEILPIDSLAKHTVGLKNNLYADYIPLTNKFRADYKTEIFELLNSVENHLKIIESEFINEIENIKLIRENRLIDKMLWTSGGIKQE